MTRRFIGCAACRAGAFYLAVFATVVAKNGWDALNLGLYAALLWTAAEYLQPRREL